MRVISILHSHLTRNKFSRIGLVMSQFYSLTCLIIRLFLKKKTKKNKQKQFDAWPRDFKKKFRITKNFFPFQNS